MRNNTADRHGAGKEIVGQLEMEKWAYTFSDVPVKVQALMFSRNN